MYPYKMDIDGGSSELWEPLWRLTVALLPVEAELLRSEWLRRLHFIHHSGPICFNTQFTGSRLQHTLGVFALVAHFEPENQALRAAALLHDVGHFPFSHTLEAITDIDHHERTEAIITSAPVQEILSAHGLNPEHILGLVNGTPSTVLRNSGSMHFDHLDSFVRSAFLSGCLPVMPHEIVQDIEIKDGSMYTSQAIGTIIKELVKSEACLHASRTNITANAVIAALVRRLLDHHAIRLEDLAGATDSVLEVLLLTHPLTAQEYKQWINEGWRITLSRDKPSLPVDYYEWTLKKLYLSEPLIKAEDATPDTPNIEDTLASLNSLKGTYYIYWANNC